MAGSRIEAKAMTCRGGGWSPSFPQFRSRFKLSEREEVESATARLADRQPESEESQLQQGAYIAVFGIDGRPSVRLAAMCARRRTCQLCSQYTTMLLGQYCSLQLS